MSTEIAPTETAPDSARIGSFIVQQSAPESVGSPIAVVGADDGPFLGVAALARTIPAPATPDGRAQTEVLLAKLRHLSHGVLVPVLETGCTDSMAYWIQATPVGTPLGDSIETGPWPISRVRDLVSRVGSAVQIAHDIGISHGSISPAAIFLRTDGSPVLAGLGIAWQGPARDQSDLATLAIGLLAEKPWVESVLDPDAAGDYREARTERMRESLSTCTERVVRALSRATDPDPVQRYPSIGEFAAEFSTAVQLSAEDLVHGAYEAISARNLEFAQLMADKAEIYDPTCEGLALLKLQLRGGSPFEKAQTLVTGSSVAFTVDLRLGGDGSPVPTPNSDALDAPRSLLPPELTEGLPQEFLDAIAPQFQIKPVKKGINPYLVLIMGGTGMVLLLAAAGLATLLLSGR